ncbi:hypothetical protein R5R35_010722 [Gryllus longicercus]|uniref:Uncharacterized protein n=2 Tax=Gryllus longicercus TaxID=2509291 RepID=A0AAN9VG91_9ORTH
MSLLRHIASRGFLPLHSLRSISTIRVMCDKSAVSSSEKKVDDPMRILQDGRNHRPDNMEKRFLVWAGKYKSLEEVPPTVPQETMEKARNKIRIKIANYMMLATIVGCIGFVYSGKQAAKRGESVQKMNMDWHKQINETSSK